MHAIAMHRRVLRASLGTRMRVTRCYSRWTLDDAREPMDGSRDRGNSRHPTQSSRFTSDDKEVKDRGSVKYPAPQDSVAASPFSSEEPHNGAEDEFQEYRHRKQSSRLRPRVEEVPHDEEGRQVFGPQDKAPVNYFTLSKKVYNLQDEPVEVTAASLDKAQKDIEGLERKAWGTLQRSETEDGEVFYTRPRTDDPRNKEMTNKDLFEISPALMDLDAWNNPNVRVFDASDEEAQLNKWSKKPRLQSVQTFVNNLETQVSASQASFDTLLQERYNHSRINAWDVVSTALRGVNPDSTPSKPPETTVEVSSRLLDPRQDSHLLQIIDKNGIPEQAQRRDSLLIDWMLMRKRRLAKQMGGKSRELRPSASRALDPEEAMREHERLLVEEKAAQRATLPRLEAERPENTTALRRGITEMLDAGLNFSSMIESISPTTAEKRTSTLLESIQAISREFSTNQAFSPLQNSKLLNFVASLMNRVPEDDVLSRLQLLWLGARLAATYDAATTAHYLEQSLRLSLMLGNSESNVPAWEDLSFIVQKLTANIKKLEVAPWDMTKAELASNILRLYTGSNDDGYLDMEAPSLRAIIVQNIKMPSDQGIHIEVQANRWMQTYDSYLEGLGHLGAARSIWAEWRSLDQLQAGGSHEAQLSDSFYKATRALLDGCPGSTNVDERAVRSALARSLEDWIDVLKKHGWEDASSSTQHSGQREGVSAVSGA